MKIFRILLVTILTFFLFQSTSFSERQGGRRRGINKKQPISIGEEIYYDWMMSTSFSRGYPIGTHTKLAQYIYEGIEDNSIKILYKNEETEDWEGSDEENNVNTEHLTIPLNENKQALLKTKDGEELVITIIDKFYRITVKELE